MAMVCLLVNLGWMSLGESKPVSQTGIQPISQTYSKPVSQADPLPQAPGRSEAISRIPKNSHILQPVTLKTGCLDNLYGGLY